MSPYFLRGTCLYREMPEHNGKKETVFICHLGAIRDHFDPNPKTMLVLEAADIARELGIEVRE